MIRYAIIAFGLAAGLTSASAAGFQCAKFEKNADGSWAVKEPVEIFGPNGRLDFTPGETYREGQPKQGLDVVKLLDANCAKK